MALEDELLKSFAKKPVTVRYPYEQIAPVEGMRGKVNWVIERCIGCALCETICPSSAIELIGTGRMAEIRYFIGRCLFCGECVDVCPVEAIETTTEYELTFTNPTDLILEFRRRETIPKSSKKK